MTDIDDDGTCPHCGSTHTWGGNEGEYLCCDNCLAVVPLGTPKIEILHIRDSDGGCDIDVYVNGVLHHYVEETVDPGRGWTQSEWDEWTDEVKHIADYTLPFRTAVIDARNAARDSIYIEED